MCGIKMTEYVFEIRKQYAIQKTIKVSVSGTNTDYNFEKAEKEAIRQIKESIDNDWLECVNVNEYTDYENEYKEAV